jgi:hypothetical protein
MREDQADTKLCFAPMHTGLDRWRGHSAGRHTRVDRNITGPEIDDVDVPVHLLSLRARRRGEQRESDESEPFHLLLPRFSAC